MKTRLLVGAACAGACLLPAAQAASTWNFEYDNLQPDAGQVWNIPTLTGSFTGKDLDHDSVIEANELTSLEIDFPFDGGVERDAILPNQPICFSPTDECAGINAFSFNTRTNQLSMDVWFQQWNAGFHLVSGQDITYGAPTGVSHSTWTEGTTFKIRRQVLPKIAAAVTPVPEPSSGAMVLAGLVALAGLARRRARTGGPGR